MKNEIIAAVVSVALNAAGLYMVHAKVEPEPLIVVGFISITMTWLSVFLTLEGLSDGDKRNLDFWTFNLVFPMLLPIALWSCIICKALGL